MDLNEIHLAQLSRFSAFCKVKRDALLAAHDAQKNDFMTDRLFDDAAIFNCADVRLLLETYHLQVVASVRDDLEKTSNLSAAFASQLLTQAQAHGLTLQVEDISIIEDQNRLAQLNNLPALAAQPLTPQPRAALAPVGAAGADLATLQELQDLRAESQQLKDRNMQLQTEMGTVLRERSMLTSELEQARAQAGGDGGAALFARQLHETQVLLEQKSQELEAVKKDANVQLSESTQFRELKSILKKKSSENRELRQRMMAAGIPAPDDGQGIELQADSD